MTQDENVILAGAQAPAPPPLPIIADAPPLAPAPDAAVAALACACDPPRPAEFAPLDLAELFALDIAQRGMVLDPIIPEKGLVLLYAMRGTGKTHVALGIAHAVATGGAFLNWRAPGPRRVLVVDGEMPVADLRSRLQAIAAGIWRRGRARHAAGARRRHPRGRHRQPRRSGRATEARALPRRRRARDPRQPGEPRSRARTRTTPTPGCRSSGGCYGCAGAASR